MSEDSKQKIQWHQAFVGAIRCELAEDVDKLDFYPEHSITKKPLQTDLLVIKKKRNDRLNSRIGRLLTEYNILEYKSPGDNLGTNAFFQALTYACYYRSSFNEGECRESAVTVMLVRNEHPKSLVEYLESVGCSVKTEEPGIYTVSGDPFFHIIILTSGEMSAEDYTWLNSLRRNLAIGDYNRLLEKLNSAPDQDSVEVVMDVVEKAGNMRHLKEDESMSIVMDKIKEGEARGEARGRQAGRQEGRQKMLQELQEAQRKGWNLDEYIKKLASEAESNNTLEKIDI